MEENYDYEIEPTMEDDDFDSRPTIEEDEADDDDINLEDDEKKDDEDNDTLLEEILYVIEIIDKIILIASMRQTDPEYEAGIAQLYGLIDIQDAINLAIHCRNIKKIWNRDYANSNVSSWRDIVDKLNKSKKFSFNDETMQSLIVFSNKLKNIISTI